MKSVIARASALFNRLLSFVFRLRAVVGALIFTNVWTFWQFGAGIVPLANHRLSKFSSSISDSPSHIPCQPSKMPTKPLISRLWRWCYSAIISAHPSKMPTNPAMARCHAGVTPLVRQSIPMNLLMISLNTLKKSALQCLWDCVGFVLSVLLIFLR